MHAFCGRGGIRTSDGSSRYPLREEGLKRCVQKMCTLDKPDDLLESNVDHATRDSSHLCSRVSSRTHWEYAGASEKRRKATQSTPTGYLQEREKDKRRSDLVKNGTLCSSSRREGVR